MKYSRQSTVVLYRLSYAFMHRKTSKNNICVKREVFHFQMEIKRADNITTFRNQSFE